MKTHSKSFEILACLLLIRFSSRLDFFCAICKRDEDDDENRLRPGMR